MRTSQGKWGTVGNRGGFARVYLAREEKPCQVVFTLPLTDCPVNPCQVKSLKKTCQVKSLKKACQVKSYKKSNKNALRVCREIDRALSILLAIVNQRCEDGHRWLRQKRN